MKRLILYAFAVAILATPARADGFTTRCVHDRYGGRCTTTYVPDAKPPVPTEDELRRMSDREAKWEAFCQPREVTGRDGIPRMQYAHRDCDIGRSE